MWRSSQLVRLTLAEDRRLGWGSFPFTQMLNLANLRTLLSRVLDFPTLHTVALFTPEGELICYETDAYKTKDHVRVIVGLSTEVWQETKDNGNVGMVDSEVWRLYLSINVTSCSHEVMGS